MTTDINVKSIELIQGTPEWRALRKTKITATDAPVIMSASPWKTKVQLYHEKLSNDPPMAPNERMQRGLDLESAARDLFTLKTGIQLIPKDDPRNVVIHPEKKWMMASFDGISVCGKYTVEIKCPGEKDHKIALKEKVPDHYFPQTQHQIEVKRPTIHYYFSFDGFDGPIFEVKPDWDYIKKMTNEEYVFYECLLNKTPPEHCEEDYIERNDPAWIKCVSDWLEINSEIKEREKIEEDLRKQLVFLSGESNTKGAGISLCQVVKKGNVDYAKIPELIGVDLDKYRKGSTNTWRITCSQ